MMRCSTRMRRGVLFTISFLCLAAGLVLLYTQQDLTSLSRAGTPAIAGLLGLMVLPGITLAARRIDRRWRQFSSPRRWTV